MASITELVAGAHPHVRRFALSLCATPEDAEDAAQEALIILYQKIGTLRASAALASWMFRIVRKECLRRSRAVLQPKPADFPETAASAEDDVIARLEAARVAGVVAALPADQRRVLIMRDIQGLPGRTVAHTLGISTSAMKSRLHRARTTVHDALARTEAHDARRLRERVGHPTPGPRGGRDRLASRHSRPVTHHRSVRAGPASGRAGGDEGLSDLLDHRPHPDAVPRQARAGLRRRRLRAAAGLSRRAACDPRR